MRGSELAKASDVNAFFAGSGGFFAWYNAKLSTTPEFAHRGAINVTPLRLQRFDAFWDKIPDAFAVPAISGLEFAALMSVSVQETNGNSRASPEKVGNAGAPRNILCVRCDSGPEGRPTTTIPASATRPRVTLFQDADYVDAHKAIAGFRGGHVRRRRSRLGRQDNGRRRSTRAHFKAEDAKPQRLCHAGGLLQAHGAGASSRRPDAITTRPLIDFILDQNPAAAANPVLMALRTTWNAFPSLSGAAKQDVIASRSTNKHWDDAFEPDDHARGGRSARQRPEEQLPGDRADRGHRECRNHHTGLLFLHGPQDQRRELSNVVAPMMSAMAKAIAALAGAAITAGACRARGGEEDGKESREESREGEESCQEEAVEKEGREEDLGKEAGRREKTRRGGKKATRRLRRR